MTGLGEVQKKSRRLLYSVENGLCVLSLVSLTLLPVMEAAARIFFKTGIGGSSLFMIHLLLWVGMLSGMAATRNEEHLSIALVQYFSGEGLKRRLRVFTNLLSAFVVTVIAWTAPAFIRIGLSGRMIGFIPDRLFALIIPLGYGAIAFRFARRTGLSGWKRIFPFLAILLGTLASFPSIAKFIWEFDLPPWASDLSDLFYLGAEYLKVSAVIFLLLAALAGTPLFVIMGGLVLILLEAAEGQVDTVATDRKSVV